MKAIFSSLPLPQFDTVYALLRITTGFLMLLHGWEVFDPTLMAEYGKWLNDLHFPAPQFMAPATSSVPFPSQAMNWGAGK